ncbi:MAG: Phosphoenolpyruvate synthase [uncultured bacterium]|nr:MAG: Phosphoenolpyruvate synthase [uncultured bacterium]HBR79103.1 hypothetical protein [Candidatus Moranbacteria bacterium]
MFTKNFNELGKNDALIAGGKGASLGEMTRAGIPVPPGFVVLAEAFEKFLIETDLNVEIEALLGTVDNQKMHTVENASEKIQALILDAKIPDDIKKEIEIEFKKLDAEYVAVRSSATAEDGAEAAWAGQLNSYLNTTQKNLIENVQKCWASLFTPRAIFYRFEKYPSAFPTPGGGIEGGGEKILVAVVVQKMIQSEKSGIAFSVHPVTQDYNQLIIEAGFGLGEAIVSGSITPDSYVVDKTRINPARSATAFAGGNYELGIKEEIIDVNVNIQNKGLYRSCHLDRSPSLDDLGRSGEISGNEWRDIPEPQASSQVLSEKEILELSKLIIKIEKHYGFPCDIEWAQENGKFYITQSRPITTLSSVQQEYRKIMTRSQNLIDCECWDVGERTMLPKKFKNLIFFDPLFIYTPQKAVSIYYNFTDPKQNLQSLIDFLEKNEDWLKKEKLIFDINCEKIRKIMKNKLSDHANLFRLIGEIWPMIAVANVLGSTEYFRVEKSLRSICIVIRNESDDVLHPAINYLTRLVSNLVVDKKYIDQILYSEFAQNKMPSKEELNKRRKGWLYHKGNITYKKEKYFQKNNIALLNPSKEFKDVITGNVASGGFAKGRARIIVELSDLKKINKGDVLVTSMTTPEMIPSLKEIVAIITDEGGITCHAAIVSREFKIPCIIGTVNATQVLKDGDLVEVDADKGVVRILERNER